MSAAALVTEYVLEAETNTAANTRWLRKMSDPAAIKGHRLHKERDGYWCACGHYCGGLEAVNGWVAGYGRSQLATWSNLKHGIHLVLLHHKIDAAW